MLVASILGAMMIVALISDGPLVTLKSFLTLQLHPGRLINDFTTVGVGAALFNAALVGSMGLILVYFAEVSLSGPTIAAIFTLTGFGLFGKTPLNCIPLIVGVWLSARLARKSLGSYSLIALFGTALGPLVSYLMFEIGLPLGLSIPLGLFAGVAAGAILPAVAGSMLQLHQGYNLYNIGFTSGFIGLFASNLLIATNHMDPLTITWNTEPGLILTLLIPAIALVFIITGISFHKLSNIRSTIRDFLDLQKLSGRLPTDYFDNSGVGAPLLNIGLLGLASWIYVLLVGAPLNGPVLGGIFTVMGFGGFGKSLKNTWPVVLGAMVATLIFGKTLSAPGPILAALFYTTLAPIAGQFGIIAGFIAGFIHLFMVETTAVWHGGLDLYNNGFAGGLTASLIIAIMQWYKTNRPKEDFTP
jgi:hypothetical protein